MKKTNAPATLDTKMGKRLTLFLKNHFPGLSESRMSREFGFPNTTVREWKKGRRPPLKAISRLKELGCDIAWLLTGYKPDTLKNRIQSVIRTEKIPITVEQGEAALSGYEDDARHILLNEIINDSNRLLSLASAFREQESKGFRLSQLQSIRSHISICVYELQSLLKDEEDPV